jgi:DNA-binding MarR family transcriptional regulator
VQIIEPNGIDGLDRREYRNAVEREEVWIISRHEHIIGVRIQYGYAYHDAMPEMPRRSDLAALLAPLLRELIAAEEPVLAAHGLSMWGYVVLLALDRSSMRTQAALAEAIAADKTRIIRTLDELQQRGHIDRQPDPDDRRVRLLAITDSGRAVKDAVQADIQRGEERWLGKLADEERRVFLNALHRMTRAET